MDKKVKNFLSIKRGMVGRRTKSDITLLQSRLVND